MTQQKKDKLLVTITFIIGILSYFLNIGWYRVIFIIPFFAYNLVTLGSCIIFISRNCNKENIIRRIVFYLSLLTYILFNVLFYDGGDIGPGYCFFGLIKMQDDSLLYITQTSAMICLIISLICIVINFIPIKNNTKNQ